MAFVTRKVLNGLIDIFFSGSPEESVGAAIKFAVDHVGGDKAWEQIFIDSLQAAIKDPSLQHYARTDGAIGLDLDLVKRAFHAELSIYDAAESDIRSPIFLEKLVDRFVELDALYVGGEQLSEDDRRHVITVVIKRLAPQYFKQFVETNESAFRQALRREALKTNTRLEVIDVYLRDHHAIVIALLTEIRDDTKAIREDIGSLPSAVADEIEARAGRDPAAKPKPRRVFISYARKDHADEGRDSDSFVQKLYHALKAAGFAPFLDHHDMPSRGTSFPQEIRDAVQDSEQFIAVCGPAYPASDWSRAERDHAHSTCITIVPVLASGEFETEVPKDIALLNGIDMRGDFDTRWPELLKRLEPLAPIPGKVIDPDSVMPDSDERDIPRTTLFEQIDAALRKDQTDPVAIAGTRALTAMYAAGGIGKTTLAAQVARACSIRRGFPDGVVWMRLGEEHRDPDALRVRLGGYFGMPAEALTGANGAANFVLRLQELDALIILDDVWSKDQVRACRVNGPNLRYLITTRLANLPNDLNLPDDNRIKVNYLTVDEGIELIARRLGLDPKSDYPHKSVHRDIVETLGYHTQAIDLAILHLRPRDQGGGGPNYAPTLLAELRRSDNTLFELLMRTVDDESREGNLLKSLSVSYKNLPTTPIDLQRLLRLLAVFAPGGSFDHIAAAAVWDMDDPERARRLLNELVGRSLITPTDDPDRYTIHALIHASARVLLAQDTEAGAAARRHALIYNAMISAHDDAGTYPRMLPDLPQLRHAFAWAMQQHDLDLMLALLGNAGNLLHQFGYSRDQLAWAEACVHLARAQGDPNKIGRALLSRGTAYSERSTVEGEDRRERLLQALADYDEALALRRDVPLAKATTLNNRANVYHDLSTVEGEDRRERLLQALADYDEALALRRDVPLDNAQTLNNRANVYRDLSTVEGEDRRGRLLQAVADYDEALALRRDVPLAKATTLNNRANVYSDLSTVDGEDRRGRLLQALADYDEALALRRDVPLAKAGTLNNRATVYSDLSTVEGEDRRERLLQALQDAIQAYEIFAAYRHTVHLPVARRVLASICRQVVEFAGIATLEGWWREITSGQPLPEWLRPPPNVSLSREEYERLANLLIDWVNTPDWDASKSFLVEHEHDLLTDEADYVLWALIEQNPGRSRLEQHRALLRTARESGIDAAFAPLTKAPFEQLQEFRSTLDRAQTPDEVRTAIIQWLRLGGQFIQQDDIPHDHLTQFIADCETLTLPKAEQSGEAQLIAACKYLLGWAYNALNVHHDNLKEYPQALAAINKAIEYQPNQAMYYRNRASDYLDLDDLARAETDIEKARELDPTAPRLVDLYHTLAYKYSDKSEHERAISACNRAIELNPNESQLPSLYFRLGYSQSELGEYALAVAAYTRAIELAPDDAMTYRNRANEYLELEDLASAEADIEKARVLDPEANHLQLRYCQLYLARGDIAAMFTHAKAAVERLPEEESAHFYHAIALALSGQLDAGFAAMRECRRLASDSDREERITELEKYATKFPDHRAVCEQLIAILNDNPRTDA